MKTAHEFAAFRAFALQAFNAAEKASSASLSIIMKGNKPVRPSLLPSHSVADVETYARALREWEAMPEESFTIDCAIDPRAVVKIALSQKVLEFFNADSGNPTRERPPFGLSTLEWAKVRFYAFFLFPGHVTQTMIADKFFVSSPAISNRLKSYSWQSLETICRLPVE
jgi:hypothetical protein